MNIYLTITIYLICWWIVLFAILPLKMGAQPEVTGSDPIAEAAGAPSSPNIKLKFVVTTVVSAVLAGAIYAAFDYELIKLDNFSFFNFVK